MGYLIHTAIVVVAAWLAVTPASAQGLLEISSGKIRFMSDAPLERIQAEATAVKGLIDLDKATFAVTVNINSFEGFNGELQREHFNENYMEAEQFPKATFNGKFIDRIDPKSANQSVRIKGSLEIHGVKNERIIPVELVRSGQGYRFSSSFNVALEDHGIDIPRMVYQKISETIEVEISGTLNPKQ
jgi:polyisoprenoid-binding protein YceI